MKRYEYCRGTVMCTISEGDPSPTGEDLDEAERLEAAIVIGDPHARFVRTDWHPEVFRVMRVGPLAGFRLVA